MKSRFGFVWLLLALMALMGLSTQALADDDPAGVWQLSIAMDDGSKLDVTVTVTKEGDALKGTLVGQDGVETELTDVSFQDGQLSFAMTRDFGGNELKSKFKGKLAEGAFDGEVDYDVAGQVGNLKVEGKRQVDAANPAGTWQLTMTTDEGLRLEPKLKLTQDGDTVSGVFLSDELGETQLSDVTYKNNELTFKLNIEFGGQSLTANVKGTLSGDELNGNVDFDLGGQTGTLAVVGKRIPEAIDPAGLWKLSINAGGTALEPTLKLAKDGDTITGTFMADDGTAVDITETSYQNNELGFKVSADFQGNTLVAVFKGTISAEGLKGTVDYDVAGQTGTLDVEGTRVIDLAGLWTIVATTEDGNSYEPKMTLSQDGGAVTVKYTWVDGSEATVSDIALEGDKLSFKVSHAFGGDQLVVKYNGTVAGDVYKGQAEYDAGGLTGNVQFEAKRATAPSVAGDWDLKISTPDGQVFEPKVTLTQDGDKISGTYSGVAGEAPISDVTVNGDEISFKVTRDRDGQEFTFNYKGKVSGDTMKGTVDYDFGGQTGSFDFEGSRAPKN